MKIYVSGKITGTDLVETESKFQKVVNKLKLNGYKVFNPFEYSKSYVETRKITDFEWCDYMFILLPKMKECDAIVYIDDEKSDGMKVEEIFANKMGLEEIKFNN